MEIEIAKRRSARQRKRKESYSPEGQKDNVAKKTKVEEQKSKGRNGIDRSCDLLPNGEAFCCHYCNSSHVVNLKLKGAKKTGRSRHVPLPKTWMDKQTGKEVLVCNACVSILDRPLRKTGRQLHGPSQAQQQAYAQEAEKFVKALRKEFDDPLVERLFCPVSQKKLCGCIQKYITHAGKMSSDDTNQEHPVLVILNLMKKATDLRKQKVYRSENTNKTNRRIGLGNGHKKSKHYEEFVLTKRCFLRENMQLCERATQKILFYSNNFLHKKLKTENRPCRLERTRGKAAMGQLPEFHKMVEMNCCTDNCIMLSLTHRRLLQDWRDRAKQSQAEARRVLAEMLTPAGASYTNCYNFISMVTGCSQTTIGRVYNQMITTDGIREPPEHGMKKVWHEKQTKTPTTAVFTGNTDTCSQSASNSRPDVTSQQSSVSTQSADTVQVTNVSNFKQPQSFGSIPVTHVSNFKQPQSADNIQKQQGLPLPPATMMQLFGMNQSHGIPIPVQGQVQVGGEGHFQPIILQPPPQYGAHQSNTVKQWNQLPIQFPMTVNGSQSNLLFVANQGYIKLCEKENYFSTLPQNLLLNERVNSILQPYSIPCISNLPPVIISNQTHAFTAENKLLNEGLPMHFNSGLNVNTYALRPIFHESISQNSTNCYETTNNPNTILAEPINCQNQVGSSTSGLHPAQFDIALNSENPTSDISSSDISVPQSSQSGYPGFSLDAAKSITTHAPIKHNNPINIHPSIQHLNSDKDPTCDSVLENADKDKSSRCPVKIWTISKESAFTPNVSKRTNANTENRSIHTAIKVPVDTNNLDNGSNVQQSDVYISHNLDMTFCDDSNVNLIQSIDRNATANSFVGKMKDGVQTIARPKHNSLYAEQNSTTATCDGKVKLGNLACSEQKSKRKYTGSSDCSPASKHIPAKMSMEAVMYKEDKNCIVKSKTTLCPESIMKQNTIAISKNNLPPNFNAEVQINQNAECAHNMYPFCVRQDYDMGTSFRPYSDIHVPQAYQSQIHISLETCSSDGNNSTMQQFFVPHGDIVTLPISMTFGVGNANSDSVLQNIHTGMEHAANNVQLNTISNNFAQAQSEQKVVMLNHLGKSVESEGNKVVFVDKLSRNQEKSDLAEVSRKNLTDNCLNNHLKSRERNRSENSEQSDRSRKSSGNSLHSDTLSHFSGFTLSNLASPNIFIDKDRGIFCIQSVDNLELSDIDMNCNNNTDFYRTAETDTNVYVSHQSLNIESQDKGANSHTAVECPSYEIRENYSGKTDINKEMILQETRLRVKGAHAVNQYLENAERLGQVSIAAKQKPIVNEKTDQAFPDVLQNKLIISSNYQSSHGMVHKEVPDWNKPKVSHIVTHDVQCTPVPHEKSVTVKKPFTPVLSKLLGHKQC